MADFKLETPSSEDDLYLARGEDVHEFVERPVFTGDVFEADGSHFSLVQHPCAMRKGASLVYKLLIANVTRAAGGIPADWSAGGFKQMFLPGALGGAHVVSFDQLDVMESGALAGLPRVAILSKVGVNLLVQRWIYHNSRVVIPTITIDLQTVGPFEEADLLNDSVSTLVAAGRSAKDSLGLIDKWLGEPHTTGGPSRRSLLVDGQNRSTVRATLRRHVKSLVEVGAED